MTRACPDCQQPLAAQTYDGVNLDTCPKCAGVWLDPGELRKLMSAEKDALETLDEQIVPQSGWSQLARASRLCPDCNLALERYQYMYVSPIQLDACGQCFGIWVEDGELEKIENWREETKEPKPRSEDEALALARFEAEHETTMLRQSRLSLLFSLFSRRPPWWRRL
jgi:Zn-finger nucleic acid-binding protein